jgi:dolichol-phosphate mannosyltransferase
MKISCIIPTKNEEATIKDVISGAKKYCDEIIVVDGMSSDRTTEVARLAGAIVVSDHGRGKGDAMKTGAEVATGEILVFLDGDGSHNTEDIPELIKPLKDGVADIVIGSRIRGGSDEAFLNLENVFRMLGGFFLSYLIKKMWKMEITDCLCGFKAIKKEKFISLNLERDDFVIEEEIIIKLLKNKGRITEIASHEFSRQGGISKLKTHEGWKFILYFLKSLL